MVGRDTLLLVDLLEENFLQIYVIRVAFVKFNGFCNRLGSLLELAQLIEGFGFAKVGLVILWVCFDGFRGIGFSLLERLEFEIGIGTV